MVVIAHDLTPAQTAVLDKNKVAYDFNPTVNLIEDPLDADGRLIEIRRPLQPGTYGINASEFYL